MAFVIPMAMAAVSAIGTAAASAGSAVAAAAPAIGGAVEGGGLFFGSGATAAASTAPGWLSAIGSSANLLGGITGALGALQQGQASANSAKYNAEIQKQNAAISRENAAVAGQAGAEQAFQIGSKTRATVGGIKANQAASGIDVNSGSAVDVRSSAAELGELDALTVRSNAAREAYGYQQQASSHDQQSSLDTFEAKNDATAGAINASSTFLGSLGSAADNFTKFQLAGGFGG